MTTDEQKLEVIAQAIYEWKSYPENNDINSTSDIENLAKFIHDSMNKQFDQPTHEPLDVQIVEFQKFWYVEYLRDDGFPRWLKSFHSKQEAIDFCVKHGLSIKK